MIFVDTSVWIAAFRNAAAPEAIHLSRLLDHDAAALAVPVRIELLSGASARQRAALLRALSALPVYYPQASTWTRIEQWTMAAARCGQRFGVADLLIAAIAAEAGGMIWSLDEDFERLARLRLVGIHRPD